MTNTITTRDRCDHCDDLVVWDAANERWIAGSVDGAECSATGGHFHSDDEPLQPPFVVAPIERKPMSSTGKIVECTECHVVMWSNNIDRHWKNKHAEKYADIAFDGALSIPTDKPLTRKMQKKKPVMSRSVPQARPVPKPVMSKLRAADIVQVTIESVLGAGGAVPMKSLSAVLEFHDAVERFLREVS